jgi:hypothetical protein
MMTARRAATLVLVFALAATARGVFADRLRPITIPSWEIGSSQPVSGITRLIPSKLEVAVGNTRVPDGYLVLSIRRTNLVRSLYLTHLPDQPPGRWPETGVRLKNDVDPRWILLPAILHGGDRTLVTWFDGDELRARIILDDGTMLDETGLGSPFPMSRTIAPQITWNGTHFVIAGQPGLARSSRLLFLSSTGEIAGIHEGPIGQPIASASMHGEVLLALLAQCAGAYCRAPVDLVKVAPDGKFSQPVRLGEIEHRDPPFQVSIVPRNDRWLVVSVEITGTVTSLRTRLADDDILLTDGDSLEVEAGTMSRAAAVGGGLALFVRSGSAIGIRPISDDGEIGDAEEEIGTSSESFHPACGNGCLVLHSNWLYRRVSAGLAADDHDSAYPLIAPPQSEPTVALTANGGLVTWMETVDGEGETRPTRIKARRILTDGTPVGPVIDLGEGYSQNVAAGDSFLVAWFDQSLVNLAFRRVAFDGTILDEAPVPITVTTPAFTKPALGFGGTTYFVAWLGWSSGVFGTTIATDGSVGNVDGVVLDPRQTDLASPPVVSRNGNEWLVAWAAWNRDECVPKYCYPIHRIEAVRVSSNGTALDTIVLGGSPGNDTAPSIGSVSGNWIAAWNESSNLLALALIDRFGNVVRDQTEIATLCAEPSVVAGGTWQGIGCTTTPSGGSDVFFLPLYTGHGLRTGAPIPVATSEDEEGQASLTAVGRTLVTAFVREDGSPEAGGAQRVYVATGVARR